MNVDDITKIYFRDPAPTTTQARATGKIFAKALQTLPKDRLARLYLDEHRSFRQIADLTGFSRHVLTRLAREYGIPLRTGSQNYRRHEAVDRDWLFEQYVDRRRTLPDLACETGMSNANMGRWARTHNIPLRRRGSAIHRTALPCAPPTRPQMPP